MIGRASRGTLGKIVKGYTATARGFGRKNQIKRETGEPNPQFPVVLGYNKQE